MIVKAAASSRFAVEIAHAVVWSLNINSVNVNDVDWKTEGKINLYRVKPFNMSVTVNNSDYDYSVDYTNLQTHQVIQAQVPHLDCPIK